MSGESASQSNPSAEQRFVLLVSGAPGSGKTTVARSLAQILRLPLLSKDPIKESLFDSLGMALRVPPAELSRMLSDAAIELLWALVPGCPRVILEANFRPKSAQERRRIDALAGRKLEVYCYCSPEEAARRFAERASHARHHPAHSLKTLSAEMLAEYDGPVGLSPVIRVDTEHPVNVPEVVARIREHWPDL